MRHLENYIARAEQLLNPADWIPFVSSFSGMIRILAGAVQVVAGAIFALIKSFEMIADGYEDCNWALKRGMLYSLHGLANIFRGSLAMIPGVNCVLFIHDNYLGRWNYPMEKMRRGVYPLTTALTVA